MAISRVPGYSLLANLDRQGTDLSLTSSGGTLQYWDVTNYRIGINTTTPSQALTVNGNVLVSNGHIYTGANLQFDLGGITNYWRIGYFGNVFGTLQTNDQPNITTVGNITNLNVIGNLTVGGQTITNTTGNLNASNNQIIHVGSPIQSTDAATKGYVDLANSIQSSQIISANLGIIGYIDQANSIQSQQITSANLGIIGYIDQANTIQSGQIGAANLAIIEANVGMKGYVDSLASNLSGIISSNITFNGNTISSNETNGNIMIFAPGQGIVQFVGQDAVGLPSGDDSTRPSYPEIGYTRYNTTRQSIEYYDGNSWLAPGAATISSEVINPDGAANTYILGSNTTVDSVLVSINGTLQQPIYSYNIVNNNQITFTETPLTSDVIEVRFISVSATSVSSLRFGSKTAIILDLENINVTGNIILNGSINNNPNLLIPNIATTTIDSYSLTSYRTVKYITQAVRANDVQSYETLVTHNGTSAVSTTYGVITIGNSLGNISASIVSSNVELQYTANFANTYVTVSRDLYPL